MIRTEQQLFATPLVNLELVRPQIDPDRKVFDYYGFEQKFRGPSKLIKDPVPQSTLRRRKS